MIHRNNQTNFGKPKSFCVPCIFFKHLPSPVTDVEGKSDLINKLELALSFSSLPLAANFEALDSTAFKTRLSILVLSAKHHSVNNLQQIVVQQKGMLLGDRKVLISQLCLLYPQAKLLDYRH